MTTVVIGVGNVVCGDDGAGVYAVRRLRERWHLPGDVAVVEGGTAGLLLLPCIEDADHAILVDAVDAGAPPGTIQRFSGDDLGRPFEGRLTPHDVGVADLVGAALLVGAPAESLVLMGVQAGTSELGASLGEPVAAALDPLADAIADQLAEWGHAVGLAWAGDWGSPSPQTVHPNQA